MEDPLNINVQLTGVDTEVPLLPESDYLYQVTESGVGPNKDETGYNWNLTLELAGPQTSVDGREILPGKLGAKVFMTMALQARADSKDPEAFKRSLGQTIDAAFGTNKDNRPNFDRSVVDGIVGKQVIAHIIIDEYQGRHSNKVKSLKSAA